MTRVKFALAVLAGVAFFFSIVWLLFWASEAYGGEIPDQVLAEHIASQPTPPSGARIERDFNRTFSKSQQYEADLDRWREKGYAIEQKYGDRINFVPRGPTYKGDALKMGVPSGHMTPRTKFR